MQELEGKRENIEPIPEDLLRDVEQDTAAELKRLNVSRYADVMNHPELPISYGVDEDTDSGLPRINQTFQPRRTKSVREENYTLEDLYVSYPEIGDGTYYLYVERTQPARWRGVNTRGVLESLHEQPSVEDFVRRYGGGTYQVSVRGPRRDGMIATLRTIKFDIPGAPITEIPVTEQVVEFSDKVTNPQLEIARLKFEEDRLRRQEEREERYRREAASTRHHKVESGITPDMFQALEQVARNRASEVRTIQQQHVEEMRSRIERLQEQLSDRDDEIRNLQNALVKERTELRDQLRNEETRQVKEIRERYEMELKRCKEDHSGNLQRIHEDYNRQLAAMTDRNSRERDQDLRTYQMERERLMTELERRETTQTNENKRQLEHLKEMYDSRINELTRNHQNMMNELTRNYTLRIEDMNRINDRELILLKETNAREIASIRSTEEVKTLLSKETGEGRLGIVINELNQLRTENAALKRENAALRDKIEEMRVAQMKDPFTAVQEAKTLLDNLGVGKEKEPEKGKEGLFEGLMGLAKVGMEKLPIAAQLVQSVREQNISQREQMLAVQRRETVAEASRQVVPSTPRVSISHPPSVQGYVDPNVSMMSVPMMAAGGRQMEPDEETPPVPRRIQRPPTNPYREEAESSEPVKMAQEESAVSPPPQPPPVGSRPDEEEVVKGDATVHSCVETPVTSAKQQADPGNFVLSPDDVNQFVGVLQNAVSQGRRDNGEWKISPSDVMKVIENAVGLPGIRQIYGVLDPDKIIGIIKQSGVVSPLSSMDGVQYLRDLWSSMETKVR